jgi:sirohydrochlorin ferrochelatase
MRLYRAHVAPHREDSPDRVAFVEANSETEALERVAAAVAAMEWLSVDKVRQRVGNCCSARDCVADGFSVALEWRLFEIGWGDGEVKAYVTEPLFLLTAPAALMRIWAQIPKL